MDLPGRLGSLVLGDGRTVDYWDGGEDSGHPVLLQPGTPCCRLFGAHFHEEARAAGLRLVSLSRPGYGRSTTTPPGLASTARDALEVADLLGLDELGALGVSGGGPFAVALACVAPSRVRSLGVVAGVGERPAGDDTAGDPTSTTQDLRADAEASMGPLLALEDAEMVATLFRTVPGGSSRCQDDPGFRATWAADLREGLGTYDGFVRDNLSWGRSWDVDPGRVSAPAFPWFGRDDQVVPSAVVTGHLDREAAPAAACPTVRTPPSRGRQREGGARWVRAVRSR